MSNLKSDREYILTGDIEDIVFTLTEDFDQSDDLARFTTYILTTQITQDNKDSDRLHFSQKELNAWYLDPHIPEAASPIFNLPYSICLTEAKLNVIESLYFILPDIILGINSHEIDSLRMVLEFIWGLFFILNKSTQKIENAHLCIYRKIVKHLQERKEYEFSVKQIIPYCEKNSYENECVCAHEFPYTFGKEICAHYSSSDDCPNACGLNRNKIHQILVEMKERGIINPLSQSEQLDLTDKWIIIK